MHPVLTLLLVFYAGDPDLTAGDAAFEARKWPEAAAAYARVVAHDPKSLRAWAQLAVARQQAGDLDGAITAYEKALGLQPAAGLEYNLATAWARKGDKDRAFKGLERAAKLGFASLGVVDTDDDLAALRGDPRWRGAREAIERNARPCAHDHEARAFDYMLGDWTALEGGGRKVGESQVTKLAGDCALLESWSGVYGGRGHGIDFWDPQRKEWRQMWVMSDGDDEELHGRFDKGVLRLTGERHGKDKVTPVRVTFTPMPDGTVRQFAEHSDDGGKTWLLDFDGVYRKK